MKDKKELICIINDTLVKFEDSDNIYGTHGGTASFLSGYLKYLLQLKQKAHLLGNFSNFPDTTFKSDFIRKRRNMAFMFVLGFHMLLTRFLNKRFIFYCHRPDHLALALIAKGKHVLHLHGQPHTTINRGRNTIKKLIFNLLERFAIPRADLIIATDTTTSELYSKLFPSLKSRILIIPTGVDLDYYDPNHVQQPFYGIVPGTKNLLYIGRLAFPKRVDLIISAFSQAFCEISSAHLWIAGSGPDEYKLKLMASQATCASNIHFTGHLSRESIRSLIHSCDAGILISQNEGSPITIKEFLASGKPVIVNNVGDLNIYISNGINGYIVDMGESESIEKAMHNVFLQSTDMAFDCRKSILEFDEMKIYKKVNQAILKLDQ